MPLLHIAGAALNQTPLAWEQNRQNILTAINEARKRQVHVLCLPELCITGYGCEDMFFAPEVHRTAVQMLYSILPHTVGIVVSVGLPVSFQNRIFNTACLMADGRILGFTAKQFLAGNGIHYEPRWFTPWPADFHGQIRFDQLDPGFPAESYAIGDIHYEVGGIKIGFEICEDAWVAYRPGRKLYRHGIDLILNPSASHFAFGKLDVRRHFVLEASRAFGVAYVYANLIGNEAGRAIYDGGTIIASGGQAKAIGPRLTFHDCLLTSAVVDIAANRLIQAQASTGLVTPELGEAHNCVRQPFAYMPAVQAGPEPMPRLADWENSVTLQEEEFARAQALGLYDYMRKSASKGFVVSLSGGADSSAIATCIWLMVRLGSESIGWDAFRQKMAYWPAMQAVRTPEEAMRLLLLTAYQPTENSGPVTRSAASTLADALGATHHELDVNPQFRQYVRLTEEALGRALSWETDDVALQNIQARVRAPSVWMLANVRGALLLSTSNRSEAAVGYATMDGDTSGGLSPIAGIDKDFLRQWLRWMEKTGVDGRLRVSALHAVNAQQPTAELRPQASGQTDEADLMPYDLLDTIEGAAIRDKKSPVACYELLRVVYPRYSREQLHQWTARFFRLWCRNQWKRERYAPSFHLDDKNLDPKTWCRFPILSGGFEYELGVLAAHVAAGH